MTATQTTDGANYSPRPHSQLSTASYHNCTAGYTLYPSLASYQSYAPPAPFARAIPARCRAYRPVPRANRRDHMAAFLLFREGARADVDHARLCKWACNIFFVRSRSVGNLVNILQPENLASASRHYLFHLLNVSKVWGIHKQFFSKLHFVRLQLLL